jgi:thioesterase domain-containing protein
MDALTSLCAELQATWHRDIPPAAAMAIAVERYDGSILDVRAPLAANRNVHGTAFAGSLFSICVLTGWGATWLALRQRGLSGVIVVSESGIRYRHLVAEDIQCRCAPDTTAVDAATERFASTGRTELALTCTIEARGKPAVIFEGTYVCSAKRR